MSSSPVSACLIVIGNEILSGRTQDRNLSWLARELNEIGIRLAEARVIPDVEQTIADTLNDCRSRFDYIFTTGGIGPTHDDITTASIAKALGVPVIRHPEAAAILARHYAPEQLNAARLKMADVPQGATLVPNAVSAAPGYKIGNIYVFAGVPEIMQAMFSAIRHELKGAAKMLSRSVSVYMTEGNLAAAVAEIQSRYADVEIGSYPYVQAGRLATSIVLRASDATRLVAATAEVEAFFSAAGAEPAKEP